MWLTLSILQAVLQPVFASVPACKDVAQTYASVTYDFAFVVNCDPGTSSLSGSCTNPYCPAGFRATSKQCTHSGLTVPICESATTAFHIVPSVPTTAAAAAGDYVMISLVARAADGSVSSTEYRDVYLVMRSTSLGIVRQQISMVAGLGVFNSPGVRSTAVETVSLSLEPYGDTISSSVLGSATSSIKFIPGPGANINFVTSETTSAYVGVTQTVQWKIYDAFGNFAGGDVRTCTRTLTTTDSSKLTCSPVCSNAAVSVTAGTGSFTVKSVKAQVVTVAVTCGSLGFTGHSTLSIRFDPLTASNVAFVAAGVVLPTTAGSSQALVVEASDSYGNLATGFTGTMTVSSSTCSALASKTVSIASGTGSVSFTSTLTQLCSFRVTGTATVPFVGSEVRIHWKPAAAYSLHITAPTSGISLSLDAAVTVKAVIKDSYGNIKTDDVASRAATLTLTPTGGSAVTKSVNFASGQLTYSLTWATLGSVVAELSSAGLLSSSQVTLVYSFGAAKSVEFESPADNTPVTAGVAVNIGLVVRDAFGNLVTTASGNLATVKSSTGTFSPSATPSFSQGRASVSFTNTATGAQTLSLSKGTSTASLVYSDTLALTYTSADAHGVRLSAAGTSFTVGSTVQISVNVEDIHGNSLAGVAGVDFDGAVSKEIGSNSVLIPASVRTGTGTVSFSQTTAGTVTLRWSQGSSSITVSKNTLRVSFVASAAVDVVFSGVPNTAISADQVASLSVVGVDSYNNPVPFATTPAVTVTSGPCSIKATSRSQSGQLLIELVAGTLSIWPQEVCDVKVASFTTQAAVTFKPGGVHSVTLVQSVASSTVSVSQAVTARLVDKFGNKVQTSAITQSYSVCFSVEVGLVFVGSNCVSFGSAEVSLSVVSYKPDIYSIYISSSKPTLALSAPFAVTFVSVKQSECPSIGCFVILNPLDASKASYTVDEEAKLVVAVIDTWGNVVEDFAGSSLISITSGSGLLTGSGSSATCAFVAGKCTAVSVTSTLSKTTVIVTVTYAGSDASVSGNPLELSFASGSLVKYKFGTSAISRTVEQVAEVEVLAVDRHDNVVESAHGSVEVYASSGIGASPSTVQLKGGRGKAELRSRVANTVVYKLRSGTGISDSALTSTFTYEYLPGEAYDWLVTGPSIAPLDVNAAFTAAVADQFRNPLGALYSGTTLRVKIAEVDSDSGVSSYSSLDVVVSSGSANFQLQYSDPKKVTLTPLGFLETSFVVVFRAKVNPPEFTTAIVKGSVTHESVAIDVRTIEKARVTCAFIETVHLSRVDDDTWLSYVETYGLSALTEPSMDISGSALSQSTVVALLKLTPSTDYTLICFAEDLLDPPNVSSYAQVYAMLKSITTLAAPSFDLTKSTKGLILGLSIGIPVLVALALVGMILYRRRTQRRFKEMKNAHEATVKLLVEADDDGTDDEQLENAIGDSSNILQEAERMQKDIIGKIKNADKSVNQSATAPEESSEDEDVKPKRGLSEVEDMLKTLGDHRRPSLTESVDSADASDLSLDKILSYTGVGHLMFELSKLLKELLSCNSEAEVDGIRGQWRKLIEGVATKHLPQQELDQLSSLFTFILDHTVADRIKHISGQEALRAEIISLSVQLFPSEIADFMDACRAESADLEDELNFHARAALESWTVSDKNDRDDIASGFKLKYQQTLEDDGKEKILRERARAIDAFDQEATAGRRALVEKLAKERQDRINKIKQKQQLELQRKLLSQRQSLQELNFRIAASTAKATAESALMERSIDDQLLPGWKVVVERQMLAREEEREKRRLADVKKHLERELAKTSTEEEREKLTAEAARLEAAVANQHQADAAQLRRELEFKLHERQDRLNQLREKKFAERIASEKASIQLAEAKTNSTTDANLVQLELSLQNGHAVTDAAVAASVEENLASMSLQTAVETELSQYIVSGNEAKVAELQARLATAETQLREQLSQQRQLQLHLLKRMFARKEAELVTSSERQVASQLENVIEEFRSAEVKAFKAAQAESAEVNKLLLDDAVGVIDREEQQLLTSLSVSSSNLNPTAGDSIVGKLQNVIDVSERMKRERAVIAECGRRRKLSEAHFDQMGILASEQLYEDMKVNNRIREVEEQQENIKTEAFTEIAKLVRKPFDAAITSEERKQVMQTWAEDEEAQQAQITDQLSQQKATLLAKAKERSEKLEGKKQKLVADRESKKARSSALLNRAIGALSAHKQLAAQHEVELASLKARHKEVEEGLRAQADSELQKMQEKVRLEQEEKRKITESKERIKRLTEVKGAKIAPEEFGAIKEARDLQVAAISQVIGEEQSVHEKILQAKLQKRQERLLKKQQAAHLQHTQAEIRLELEMEQARVKALEANGDVDALMRTLERVNALVSRLNESTVAPVKAAKSMRSGLPG